MSAEQQFQLLISNQDYLNLQSKCNQLQALCQKLTKQNKDYSLKIFDLKEQNEALLARNIHTDQKIRELQNQSRSWSAQIADLQCTLEKSMSQKRKIQQQKEGIKKQLTEVSKMKEKRIQKLQYDLNNLEKGLDESKKQLLSFKEMLKKQRASNEVLKQQINHHRNEMKSKEKIIEKTLEQNQRMKQKTVRHQKAMSQQFNQIQSQCEIMRVNLNKCSEENEKKSKKIELLLSEQKILQKQLVSKTGELKVQQTLNVQTKMQRQKQLGENLLLKKQVQSVRDKLTAQQKNKSENKYKQSIEEELKMKILELQSQVVRQKKNSEVIEKQYEQIISNLEKQKKLLENELKLELEPKSKPSSRLNDKTQKDQLQQIKTRLQQYFTNLAVNLYEVGNLDQQDIKGILVQQEEIVKSYVTDITAPFVIKRERGPPQFHRY